MANMTPTEPNAFLSRLGRGMKSVGEWVRPPPAYLPPSLGGQGSAVPLLAPLQGLLADQFESGSKFIENRAYGQPLFTPRTPGISSRVPQLSSSWVENRSPSGMSPDLLARSGFSSKKAFESGAMGLVDAVSSLPVASALGVGKMALGAVPKLAGAAGVLGSTGGRLTVSGVPTLKTALQDSPITSGILEQLPDRAAILPQDIRAAMNKQGISGTDKEVFGYILKDLESEGKKSISVPQLMDQFDANVEPFKLTRTDDKNYTSHGLANIGRRQGWTKVYETPEEHGIETAHWPDNLRYAGHTRGFHEDGVPHVVELQSDLAQMRPDERPFSDGNAYRKAYLGNEEQERLLKAFHQNNDVQNGDFVKGPALIRQLLGDLEQHNPDVKLVIGENLKALDGERGSFIDPERKVETFIDLIESPIFPSSARMNAWEKLDDAIRGYRSDFPNIQPQILQNIRQDAQLSAITPTLKKMPERLVREELAAATKPTIPDVPRLAPHTVEALQNNMAHARAGIRQLEEHRDALPLGTPGRDAANRQIRAYQDRLREAGQRLADNNLTPSALPPADRVRFATADTTAKVEGWPRAFEGNLSVIAQRTLTDARRQIEVRGPDSVNLQGYRYADIIKQLEPALIPEKFVDPGHQSVYNRYRKEIEPMLIKMGGVSYTDAKGHTWIEVPLNDGSGRVKLFSVGAAGVISVGTIAASRNPDGAQ